MQLKKEFHHVKMKEDETMSAYIARVKTLATNLREAETESSDEDVAYVSLAGLLDSYESLNMSLASLPNNKFTSTEVKRVLLTEYDRRKTRQDEVSTSKEALQTKKSDRKMSKVIYHNSNGNKQKSVVYYRCKKVGHIFKNCRVK